ncbi:MAG: hypothetical protein JWO31_2474, partial [Phycisphaerales bacterium]|nr:hypothetical protein [Phycisphaerales bacterium]
MSASGTDRALAAPSSTGEPWGFVEPTPAARAGRASGPARSGRLRPTAGWFASSTALPPSAARPSRRFGPPATRRGTARPSVPPPRPPGRIAGADHDPPSVPDPHRLRPAAAARPPSPHTPVRAPGRGGPAPALGRRVGRGGGGGGSSPGTCTGRTGTPGGARASRCRPGRRRARCGRSPAGRTRPTRPGSRSRSRRAAGAARWTGGSPTATASSFGSATARRRTRDGRPARAGRP